MDHTDLSFALRVNYMKVLKVNDNYNDFTHFIRLIHLDN
jgi:hypothetical protein